MLCRLLSCFALLSSVSWLRNSLWLCSCIGERFVVDCEHVEMDFTFIVLTSYYEDK
jgi:hypothetical protein